MHVGAWRYVCLQRRMNISNLYKPLDWQQTEVKNEKKIECSDSSTSCTWSARLMTTQVWTLASKHSSFMYPPVSFADISYMGSGPVCQLSLQIYTHSAYMQVRGTIQTWFKVNMHISSFLLVPVPFPIHQRTAYTRNTYSFIYIYIYIQAHQHTHTHAFKDTKSHTHTYNTHTRNHIHTHTRTHINIHTYTNINTHTHTKICI